MKQGDLVFYAQFDSPPLRGRVLRCYERGTEKRIVVQLDDPERQCPVDAMASSVFTDRKAAELAAK